MTEKFVLHCMKKNKRNGLLSRRATNLVRPWNDFWMCELFLYRTDNFSIGTLSIKLLIQCDVELSLLRFDLSLYSKWFTIFIHICMLRCRSRLIMFSNHLEVWSVNCFISSNLTRNKTQNFKIDKNLYLCAKLVWKKVCDFQIEKCFKCFTHYHSIGSNKWFLNNHQSHKAK